ncbi:MAG: SemiSWEET transporter [Nanoarchaeota archaeon]|nr:SemiSWEET transporter [Nanoarchaeota archaeon]MBU1135536.1 SemiSWEET transporter [Nanoarchaeota archaeon]MBU2519750.1 SemiSWEET transporter [Nanoarchaeota archaeon]
MDSVFIGYVLGYVGACCTTFSYIAQIKKSVKTKNTEDLSLLMHMLIVTGVLTWLLYGISVGNWVLILANSAVIIFNSIIVFLILRYSSQRIKPMILLFIVIYFGAAVVLRILGIIMWIGFMGGIMTAACVLPQFYKSWKTRKTKDISLPFYSVLTTGVFLWLLHGILVKDIPIIVANIFTFATVAGVLILKLTEKRVNLTE